MEIFVGCVEEDLQGIEAGSQIDYCGCVTKGVSVGMTVKEVMRLGLDMTAAGKDKELEIIAANDRLADYIAECAVKLYE